MIKRASVLAAAVLGLIAGAHAAEGAIAEEIAKIEALAEAARAPSIEPALREIFEADLEFAEDAATRHVSDAFADRFLADGMMFPDGRAVVVGPDAVREALKDSKAEWRWAPVDGKIDGDLAVTWGRAFLVVRGKDGEDDQTYRSRYVTVWSRGDDGAWRIWIDLGTAAGPDE